LYSHAIVIAEDMWFHCNNIVIVLERNGNFYYCVFCFWVSLRKYYIHWPFFHN